MLIRSTLFLTSADFTLNFVSQSGRSLHNLLCFKHYYGGITYMRWVDLLHFGIGMIIKRSNYIGRIANNINYPCVNLHYWIAKQFGYFALSSTETILSNLLVSKYFLDIQYLLLLFTQIRSNLVIFAEEMACYAIQ